MALYSYRARDMKGQLITGTLEAESSQNVFVQLQQKMYVPVDIAPAISIRSGKAAPLSPRALPKPVPIKDMMVFCVNLSSMVSSGVPLLGALNVLSKQMSGMYLGYVVGKVASHISDGSSFSDALGSYPDVFSKFFCNMIRVAELSGTMDNVLKTLALHMQKQEDMRQKIIGALAYPVVLAVAGALVILLIIMFVMPQFVGIFTKAGVPMPLPTRMMYHMGLWLKQYWFVLPITIAAAVVGFKAAFRTKIGRDVWDRFVLRTPVFGPLNREMLIARFSRTLGALLDSGVPILISLEILRDVIDNSVFARIITEVRLNAEKGEGVHRTLALYKEFPDEVVYMISVGESSGKMGAMLNKVAEFYETRVEFSIKAMMVMIEPLFIAIMGVCVGGMLASVILPMFDMVKTIQK